MTLSRVSLIMERRTTVAFIQADPTQVTLQTRGSASDGKGGRVVGRNPRAPQTCRVIPARSRSTSLTYTLPDGRTISSKDSLLVGLWDMEVETNDWFMYSDIAYQVSFIEPDRQFQTLCQLDYFGESFVEGI